MINIHEVRNNIINLFENIPDSNDIVKFLDTTDFYIAPASIRYHLAEEGGLAKHSYDVCITMLELKNHFDINIPDSSIIKVALLHELGKINFYESYTKKEPDANGNWVPVNYYRVKDAKHRDIYGDTGFNSYMIASRYISFTDDEITAICNCNHVNNPGTYLEINDIMIKSPLTLLLHTADLMNMYLFEK